MNFHQLTLGPMSRRQLLQSSALASWSLSMGSTLGAPTSASTALRFGLITDVHYADKPPAGTRHYRESVAKLEEAAVAFEQAQVAFVVELGDLIDAADEVHVELGYLQTINRVFSQIAPQRHYVLGNHCVDLLTKPEFLGEVEQEKSYYSFDHSGCHFILLDACFRADHQDYGRKNAHWTDTNIPPEQLEWLQADLQATANPVIVFAHQRLDVDTNHGVKNNAAVREVLEESQRVVAVFQGHSHENALNQIGGIPYCTLVAMVEGSGEQQSGYAIVEVTPEPKLSLQGFRRQESHRW